MIHGGIDGFSRLIVFLKCSTNNKAATVLSNFMSAVQKYKWPEKVRSDHGTENVLVARCMIEKFGVENRPFITGKSVHNQRIERLWVDVSIYVIQQFKNTFSYLEEYCDFTPDNELHVFVIQTIYLARINQALAEFERTWNLHLLSTERNKTPLAIWSEGFLLQADAEAKLSYCQEDVNMFGVDFDGPMPELQTINHVQIPQSTLQFSENVLSYLNQFNPLEDDGNFCVELCCNLLQYLEQHYVHVI